ncbi:hypothetical protein [Actinomadura rugatobispora]|uniref:Uncharacterized protein n=1 Tax=Actinomadura rugatobispora TaxID=1994 RepID=A0ABW0ZTP3_9ACTN|nr:hypothetical protein GCM10010200_058830 [Actinomadura rugatobispora]
MRPLDPLALAGLLIRYGAGVWTLVLWVDLFRDACVTETLDDHGLLVGAAVLLGTDTLARIGRFLLPPLLYGLAERLRPRWEARGLRRSSGRAAARNRAASSNAAAPARPPAPACQAGPAGR